MQICTIKATLFAFLFSLGTSYAEDINVSVLEDLSFGGSADQDERSEETLSIVKEVQLDALTPVVDSSVVFDVRENRGVISVLTPRDQAIIERTPRVELMQPLPIPVPRIVPTQTKSVLPESAEPVTASVVGYRHNHDVCAEVPVVEYPEIYCRTREAVQLPTSSFYEYFRSHPCYTNVWEGYGIHCGSHHKHLHGECECFKNSSTGNCDCHHNPHRFGRGS